MTSTFKRNMLIGFGSSLLLLIISAVASYTSISRLLESSRLVDHTNNVILEVENVLSAVKDAETGQRGFLLTGKNQFLGPYNGARTRAMNSIDQVKSLTADNPGQQARIDRLRLTVEARLDKLDSLVAQKRANVQFSESELDEGRRRMDEIRATVAQMKDAEELLLTARNQRLVRFSGTTPIVILVASALAIVITIVFFLRLNADYQNRLLLQAALEEKDRDITRRINIIQDVAANISAGDYSIRVSDEGRDGLGSLSGALNKMAGSLEFSFNTLADKEWLQAGIATLNEKMLGEREIKPLSNIITAFVTEYSGCAAGVLYIAENNDTFALSGTYAMAGNSLPQYFAPGEGIGGQAAMDKQPIILTDIPQDNILISHAAGTIKPVVVAAVPLLFENRVNGVLELLSLRPFSTREKSFLESVAGNIGTIINTAKNRLRLQELLEETQSQSEELQAQHAELENMNVELEMKTERLQASEEELRVQQEELMQANQELEEKAVSLEEKNQLIIERNIDIQRKAEELALSTRYKSEFLANMSHELRTPLNSILLLSRLLSENTSSNLSADQVEYASVIQSSGQGLLTLINEILDLSKIESGKMELEYAHVPVDYFVKEANALFLPLAKEKHIGFEVNVAPGLPSGVETDATRLGQIIKNLLSNAFKFTSQGSVTLSIKPAGAHYYEICVTDTGIGIAQEKQDMIFEAFRQADGSTRRKYGGTGLGLSITKELVRLLGGEINLESEPGKGSSFTVKLPVNRPSASELTEIQDLQPPLAAQQAAGQEPERFLSLQIPENIPDDRNNINSGDKCIVIVEDDVNFARSLLEFTRKKGYKGIVAVRGDEGIELVKQFKPTGVLLDIQLPVKDGWQVMDELKSDAKTRHIPVHIVSSHEVKRRSIAHGAVSYANKPVDPSEMQEIFKKIEYIIEHNPRKVLIVEEDRKHARALAFFLENYHVNTEITGTVHQGIEALQKEDANCVILDLEAGGEQAYSTLEEVKRTPGLEQLPIIVFTGKSLSKTEEMRIRQYADSIVVKTANSYQRILDEVSLFLHLMEEHTKPSTAIQRRLGGLSDVLQGKTVLVADDDVRNVFSLTRALENYKMTVLPAIDGKEALKQLESHAADVVLMDMMMPEMDGYETIRRMRANPKYRNLPIIAVTAKAMAGDREKCISAGASDYITKPVDIDQLVSLLRVWLYEDLKI